MTPFDTAEPDANDSRPKRLMKEALASPTPRLDLIAVAIAAIGDPDVDADACLARLDELGDRVRDVASEGGVRERLEGLRQVLAVEERFRGDPENYGAPENSFLDRVLATRKGLPITLSLLYVEVARRAGLSLFGVPFPAHFIAGAQLESGERVAIDAFASGRILTPEECEELLQRVAPGARFHPGMLTAATPRAIAFRMLNNLKRVYVERGDDERSLQIVDLMLLVEPKHPGELRARAMLYQKLGAFRAALADIEACLTEVDPPDRTQLNRLAKDLRERVTMLN